MSIPERKEAITIPHDLNIIYRIPEISADAATWNTGFIIFFIIQKQFIQCPRAENKGYAMLILFR
jgi:hypothetical protein